MIHLAYFTLTEVCGFDVRILLHANSVLTKINIQNDIPIFDFDLPVVRAKFTVSQYLAIAKYMEQHSIKSESHFVREAVMTKIGIDLANSKKNPGLSDEYVAVYYFAEDYKDTLTSRPSMAKHFSNFFKKWSDNYLTNDSIKTNKKLQEISKDAEAFLLARRGRPRNPKNPRGRKPDKGTDVEKRTLSQ